MELRHMKIVLFALASVVAAAGCSSDSSSGGEGNLSVVLGAEETIPEGLASGDCEECILDGYSVTFSRYIVTTGFVQMSQNGANPQESATVGVADYTSLPTSLPELTAFNNIPTGQYTDFGYDTPIAEDGVVNINSVSQEDVDAMIDNGWSYIIEGTLTQVSDGATIDFLITADVPAVYTDCALEDQEPGVNVQRDSTAEITIHGDHVFFNGFPEDEGNVQRLAAWMWTVGEEQDTDGVITQEDFEAATNIEELFPSPPAGPYELTGSPVTPINNSWDFVRAQLGTQGHIFGEGECEWGPLD